MKNILNYTIYYNGLLEFYELNYRGHKFYTQLTLADRKNIAYYYNMNYSYSQIGLKIGKDKSTVCREIKRNSIPWASYTSKHKTRYKYRANKAHKFAQNRTNKGKVKPTLLRFLQCLQEDIELKQSFEDYLLGMKNNLTYQFVKLPTLKTIYNWYHKKYISFQKTNVYKTKVYTKRPLRTRNFNSIHNRCISLTDYTTPGHYEIDLVLSSDKLGGILTFNHRASMKLYARKVKDKQATTINKALRSIIKEIGADNIASITSDNGLEFNYTTVIEQCYNIKYYKADPYVSGQRGQNERLNRDIRLYYPKGTNFTAITEAQLQEIILTINKKHRRKFNGLTALQQESKIISQMC